MILHKCPSCEARLESPAIYAGGKDKCPACGQAYIVPEPPRPSVLTTALRKALKPRSLRFAAMAAAALVAIIATGLIVRKAIQRQGALRPPPGAPATRIAGTRPIQIAPTTGTKPSTTSRPTVPATAPATRPATAPATETAPATQTQPITRPATAPATKPTTRTAKPPALPDRQYAKTLTLDLDRGGPLKLRLIRAGKFVMGSPDDELERKDDEPRHWATITRHFYLAEHEVTKEQYKAVMAPEAIKKLPDPEIPMTAVSWHDTAAFCRNLSKKTGRTVKLPTEAQWEYACRAGAITPFNTGEKLTRTKANYDGKYFYGLGDLTLQETGPWPLALMRIRSFKPNQCGLYDMHGNVAEWCRDWYGPYRFAEGDPRKQAKDPAGPAEGTKRILRGGSWRTKPARCRSAARGAALPEHKSDDVGFRVLVEVEVRDAVD